MPCCGVGTIDMVVFCLLKMGGFAFFMPFDFMYDSSWLGISAKVSLT